MAQDKDSRLQSFRQFLKKTLFIITATALTQHILISCGEDHPIDDIDDWNEDENYESGSSTSSYSAPDSPIGKIISWSERNSDGTSGNSDVRVKFINSTDIQTNFSDWCTYTYKKTSSKKAHLNFMAPQTVGSTVRTFQYDFDITFTSSTEFEVDGTLKVNYLSGPNLGNTSYNKFTGKGKFVNSLSGNEKSEDSQSPGSPENIAKYEGRWAEDVDKSLAGWSLKQTSYTFKSDGTFSHSYAMGVLISSGNFKCTSSTILLYVDSKLQNTLSLNNGKLVDSTNKKTFSKQ